MTTGLGWIRKVTDESSDQPKVPVGTMFLYVRGYPPPAGWEWVGPSEVTITMLDGHEEPGRLITECFSEERAGQECPIPSQCEECNDCILQSLSELGWRVEPPS